MPTIVSLADEGYRQFGPLPAVGGGQTADEIAERISKVADYETAGVWVRRRARKKGGRLIRSFDIIDVLDRTIDLGGNRLAFMDEYLRSDIANTDTPRVTTDNETLLSLIREAKETTRWQGMYRLNQALNYAGHQRILSMLRDHVLPCFFDLCPKGKVAVVRYNMEYEDAAALMRLLYVAAQTPLQDVAAGNFKGVGTLQQWHKHALVPLGRVLLNTFLYLFYPFIAGYLGGMPGLDLLFLFEPAEKYMPDEYPRNWLAIASTTAGFGHERIDLVESLRDFEGSEWQRSAHQRFQYGSGYTIDERLSLLEWYVSRLNRLLYELTDVANFTENNTPNGCIDPILAFEHHLSVDRLARKTLLAMSLEEVGTAKHLVFEVADMYGELSRLFGNHPDPTGLFKQLFHTQDAPAILRDRLKQLPAPFGVELSDVVQELYRRIEDTIINSIWLKSKVTPQGVMVRNRDLSQEAAKRRPEFVADLMRCYRNAHHGYFTAADPANRPSRYLFLADGNLPVEITALPALWWLAYLADPGMIGWEPLSVDTFA